MPKAIESPVTQISMSESGNPLVVEPVGPALRLDGGELATTPGTVQDLLVFTVPASTTWRLRNLEVISRAYGFFDLLIGGVSVKDGKTGPAQPTVIMPISPYLEATAGQEVKVTFKQESGPIVPVEARIYYTD